MSQQLDSLENTVRWLHNVTCRGCKPTHLRLGWVLRRLLSNINRIYRRRELKIGELCAVAGVTWPAPKPRTGRSSHEPHSDSAEEEFSVDESVPGSNVGSKLANLLKKIFRHLSSNPNPSIAKRKKKWFTLAVRAIRRCPASHTSPEGTKEEKEKKEGKRSRAHCRFQYLATGGGLCGHIFHYSSSSKMSCTNLNTNIFRATPIPNPLLPVRPPRCLAGLQPGKVGRASAMYPEGSWCLALEGQVRDVQEGQRHGRNGQGKANGELEATATLLAARGATTLLPQETKVHK